MPVTIAIARLYRQNIGVATAFWAACLVLVAIEVAVGAVLFVGIVFCLSIPVLVGLLTWVNRAIVFERQPRQPGSVLVLGVAVLFAASVIVFVGLLAAANLKTLIAGA